MLSATMRQMMQLHQGPISIYVRGGWPNLGVGGHIFKMLKGWVI